MNEIILHHYPKSPFAEKVRLILGYKNLRWSSVIIPDVMPKPDLIALTGGYRRTPVLQIGADIYCDTPLIVREIDKRWPPPPLFPAPAAGLSAHLEQWADSTLFWTAMAHAFQASAIPFIFAGASTEKIKAFMIDRAAMRGSMPRQASADASGALLSYLERLEDMLADDSPFLLGSQPTIADFAVAAPLWFVDNAGPAADILHASPALKRWLARMQAIGHGEWDDLSAAAALAIARDSQSQQQIARCHADRRGQGGRNASNADADADSGRDGNVDCTVDSNGDSQGDDDDSGAVWLDFHGLRHGDRVSITPTDYALDPVHGELVLSNKDQLALRRQDDTGATLVVHFPRAGFQLKKQ